MGDRPTLSDRFLFAGAKLSGRWAFAGFSRATRHVLRSQERTLLAKIRRNASSDFGRTFGFQHIRSVEDFRRQVPLMTYEDHLPYIERVRGGEIDAMFGTGQRVHMFAMSSGTTATPKYVPVTTDFLTEYKRGWNAFGVKSLLDNGGFLRPIVQVTSRMDECVSTGGIPCGAITGLMAHTQKRIVRKYYVTPPCIAHIDDFHAKYYTIMRLGLVTDPAFVITANPATTLKLARTVDEHAESLIRDIRDGTLTREIDVSDEVRRLLAPRLVARPEVAQALEDLLARHGRLLPRHYWNLNFLANWTGGTLSLYLSEFPEYFGETPVRDIGLLASEGRITLPIDNHTPAGILEILSNFFEFIPREEMGTAQPRTLLCHELEVGREYYVILTNSAGFYRYDLHDLVRCVGYHHQAPLLEFLNKGQHIASLAGEKLTEHQVIQAMQEVSAELRSRVSNFILAARWGHPPSYMLHVEPHGDKRDPGGASSPLETLETRLGILLDQRLCAQNSEYANRRQSGRLGPIAVNRLPAGYLNSLDLHEAAEKRPGNEQYKHRYLYCAPGEDAQLPVVSESHTVSRTG